MTLFLHSWYNSNLYKYVWILRLNGIRFFLEVFAQEFITTTLDLNPFIIIRQTTLKCLPNQDILSLLQGLFAVSDDPTIEFASHL